MKKIMREPDWLAEWSPMGDYTFIRYYSHCNITMSLMGDYLAVIFIITEDREQYYATLK